MPAIFLRMASHEQANDERMIAMMVEMTRFFCGDAKADQIAGLATKLTPADQWDQIAWDQVAWSRGAEDVARFMGVGEKADASFGALFSCAAATDWPQAELCAGLALWARRGGHARWRGRSDHGLHLIHGAWIEAVVGLGALAGLVKEQRDRNQGGVFDGTDLMATVAGAAWSNRCRQPGWRQRWAALHLRGESGFPEFAAPAALDDAAALAECERVASAFFDALGVTP